MEKVAVVTGTSSGIGFETALALAREGYYTYATMRDTTTVSYTHLTLPTICSV